MMMDPARLTNSIKLITRRWRRLEKATDECAAKFVMRWTRPDALPKAIFLDRMDGSVSKLFINMTGPGVSLRNYILAETIRSCTRLFTAMTLLDIKRVILCTTHRAS